MDDNELDALPLKHLVDQIAWDEHRDISLENFHNNIGQADTAKMHDILKFGGGVSYMSTFCWHILGKMTNIPYVYPGRLFQESLTCPRQQNGYLSSNV